MKQTNSQKFNLGLFIIIGTLLFIAAVYFIGQRQDMFKKTFTISALFQNVNGLQKGNNVRFAGINIGTVKGITMVNDSTIKIDMSIDEKIITHIKKDAIATIGSDGLVGNMIVNIVPGKGSKEVISNGDHITSYSKIGTNNITKGKGTIGVLLNDTIMAKDLKLTITNLKNVSYGASNSIGEVNELLKELKTNDTSVLGMLLNDTISGSKLKNIISHLETSSTQIDSVVRNINTIVTNFETSEGTYNYIVKDTSMVNSLKSTLEHINEGSDKFNQNMEALKHNFLTRGYFKKLERQEKRAADKTKE